MAKRIVSIARIATVENRVIGRIDRNRLRQSDAPREFVSRPSRRRLAADIAELEIAAAPEVREMVSSTTIEPLVGHLWSRGKGRKVGEFSMNSAEGRCWKRRFKGRKAWDRARPNEELEAARERHLHDRK